MPSIFCKRFGAVQTAELLARVLAVVNPNDLPPAKFQERLAVQMISEEQAGELDQPDSQYYQLEDKEPLVNLLAAYLRRGNFPGIADEPTVS